MNRYLKPIMNLSKKSVMIGLSLALVFSFLPVSSLKAQASTNQFTVNFPQSSSQQQTQTVALPSDFDTVNSVSVNTGTVDYNISGSQMNLTVDNGTPVSQNSYYDPTLNSKNISTYSLSDTNSFSSTYAYSDADGYSGTLNATGAPYVVSGSLTSGSSEPMTITASNPDPNYSFPATQDYFSNGYSGTLTASGGSYQSLSSGQLINQNTESVSSSRSNSTGIFPNSVPYDDGSYKGLIAKSGSSTLSGSTYTQNYSGTIPAYINAINTTQPSSQTPPDGSTNSYSDANGYQGTLNKVRTPDTNKWLAKEYSGNPASLIPQFSDISGKTPVKEMLFDDSTSLLPFNGDTNYIAEYTTYVYVPAALTSQITASVDDGYNIFLNGTSISTYHYSYGSMTSVTFNFTAGWNKIDILYDNKSDPTYFNFSDKISSLVEDMDAKSTLNQWQYEVYSTSIGHPGAPYLSDVNELTPISSGYMDDSTSFNLYGLQDYYMQLFTTNVYVSTARTINISAMADDCASIYVNGTQVVPITNHSSTAYSFSLPAGWSKLQIIYFEVSPPQYLQFSQTLSSQVDIMDAYTTANKWLVEKYPKNYGNWTTIPTLSEFDDLAPVDLREVNDASSILVYNENDYVARYQTNVYVSSAKTLTLNSYIDDTVNIYVNGVSVASSSPYGSYTLSIPLKAGWNKLDVLYYNYNGGISLNFGQAISSQVEKMDYAVPNNQWILTKYDPVNLPTPDTAPITSDISGQTPVETKQVPDGNSLSLFTDSDNGLVQQSETYLWSNTTTNLSNGVLCSAPCSVYLNGSLIFSGENSTATNISLPLQANQWNKLDILSYVTNSGQSLSFTQPYSSLVSSLESNYLQYYSGRAYSTTVDTREYQSNQVYSGTVYGSGTDTRVWRRDYSGTVYNGGTTSDNAQYAYTVTVNYNQIPASPSVCTYKNIGPSSITATNYLPKCISMNGSTDLFSYQYDFTVTGISNASDN